MIAQGIYKGVTHMNYKGSCHCGDISFEAEGELKQVIDCNCSICTKKASLLWFISTENFHLLSPEENINTYTFNKHLIHHKFCKRCGMHPFAEGVDPKGNRMVAVNVRCLENVDISNLSVHHFNGKDL